MKSISQDNQPPKDIAEMISSTITTLLTIQAEFARRFQPPPVADDEVHAVLNCANVFLEEFIPDEHTNGEQRPPSSQETLSTPSPPSTAGSPAPSPTPTTQRSAAPLLVPAPRKRQRSPSPQTIPASLPDVVREQLERALKKEEPLEDDSNAVAIHVIRDGRVLASTSANIKKNSLSSFRRTVISACESAADLRPIRFRIDILTDGRQPLAEITHATAAGLVASGHVCCVVTDDESDNRRPPKIHRPPRSSDNGGRDAFKPRDGRRHHHRRH